MRLALTSGWREEEIWEWVYEGKLARWLAYFQLEPFGPVQEDLRSGWIASLIYNSNRGKDAEAKGPEFFFPSLAPAAEVSEEKDDAEQIWRMRIWVAMQQRKSG